MPCENFLYGFKGACGASRAGSPPRQAQARRHPRAGPAQQPAARAGAGRRPTVAGAAALPRPSDGGPADAAAAPHRWPLTRRGGQLAVSRAGTPADATARPLALGILSPRKDHRQGRSLRSRRTR